MKTFTRMLLACGLAVPFTTQGAEPALPERDQRAAIIKTLNTLRTFPEVISKSEWQQRAHAIRAQVLVR